MTDQIRRIKIWKISTWVAIKIVKLKIFKIADFDSEKNYKIIMAVENFKKYLDFNKNWNENYSKETKRIDFWRFIYQLFLMIKTSFQFSLPYPAGLSMPMYTIDH